MHASLRAFLSGLIDYAGLFPPARLPLEQALGRYADYRASHDAWMLGRFVCPAGRLDDLAELLPGPFTRGRSLALALLVGNGETAGDFRAGLGEDLQALGTFLAAHGERVRVEVLEARLPAAVADGGPAAVAELVRAAGDLAQAAVRAAMKTFYEVAPGPGWRERVEAVLGGLARLAPAGAGRRGARPAGFKLRCGGQEPTAVPLPEQVAFVITQCRDHGIPLKATAGLHHPLRRFDPALQARAHGFVNVFGAAVLAHARWLGEGEVRHIVEDEDQAHFVFDDQRFGWRDFQATTAEVKSARDESATSFGSCSFDEPRADLRALGWM
jgi:hypothetical protein